ncbi:hypothetical protein D3871_15540 [Noviherbaspirillum saxi]|uniref:Uncharacterized protein n=1 Tax=Noviherbaspirillum saxi TaxID=2320863 RepID=A0A3A3GC36_9BURK|nr:hypothetical protein D3871_15540 [Noviherbaspirillum saxi]
MTTAMTDQQFEPRRGVQDEVPIGSHEYEVLVMNCEVGMTQVIAIQGVSYKVAADDYERLNPACTVVQRL